MFVFRDSGETSVGAFFDVRVFNPYAPSNH